MLLTRRRFLQAGTATALAGIGGVALGWHTAADLQHTFLDLRFDTLPPAFDGFRILHLTDLHVGGYFSDGAVEQACGMAATHKPDLVALTGDYVTGAGVRRGAGLEELLREDFPRLAELLRLFRGVPTFAVLGNHDGGPVRPHLLELFASEPVPVLRNASLPIERAGSRLWVCGVDDAITGGIDLEKTFAGVPVDEFRIALMHEPDLADEIAPTGTTLQLSGHSHGGQLVIPGGFRPVLPNLARKYPSGHYRVGKMQLYTNRGAGGLAQGLRVNCPPEAALFTLRSRATV